MHPGAQVVAATRPDELADVFLWVFFFCFVLFNAVHVMVIFFLNNNIFLKKGKPFTGEI